MEGQKMILVISKGYQSWLAPRDRVSFSIIDENGNQLGDPISLETLAKTIKNDIISSDEVLIHWKHKINQEIKHNYIKIDIPDSSPFGCFFSLYSYNERTREMEITQDEQLDYMDIIFFSDYITNTFNSSR